MGFFSYFRDVNSNTSAENDLEMACFNLEKSLGYRKLALEITIDMVANSVARTDWQLFPQDTNESKATEYLLNVAPNPVETSTEFFKHLVKRLMLDGEVLIYPDEGSLYVAESFGITYKKRGVRRFDCIMIEGDNKVINNKTDDDVIYIKYNTENIKNFMSNYLNDYEKLVNSGVNSYRTNKTRRFVLDSNMFGSATTDEQKSINNMVTSQLAEWASSDQTAKVYGKTSQWDITNMSDSQIESANDSRKLIQDIFGIVAQTYHVPVQMIVSQWEGTTISQAVIDNYLLGIVFPIVDLFKEAINKFTYTKDEYAIQGKRIQADTTKVRLTDLRTIGTFISQVFPTGALSLNDIVVKYLQQDPLPEDIGNIRVVTKNYAKIDDFNNGMTSETNVAEDVNNTQQNETGGSIDE